MGAGLVGGDGAIGWRSGRLTGLGLIIAGCRRCTCACLVAGGTVKLRLAGRPTIRPGVFTLLLLFFALVPGVDLLRRVLAICWVQPELLLRLGNTVIIHLRSKGAGVYVVRLGVRGITSPGQRAASTCAPAR